jgi:formate-dependent nitrite reductase cytochrome c552 subunit
MRAKAAHETLGCTSCHVSHGFDTQHAAADACLACHDDDHTRSWAASPHAALWQAEVQGRAPAGSGVSCATCHLPRVASRESGETVIHVEHNQNANLRPSDKMLRTSCMQCHGLAFSIDALADKALVARNFRGRPSVHVESIEMAVRNLHDSSQSRGKSP